MILREIALFKDIDSAVMEKITDTCTEEFFEQGFVIFNSGDTARSLYILQEGSIKLGIEKAASFSFRLTDQGSLFGWSSMAETGLYTSTAVCEKDSKVIKLDNNELDRIFRQHPDIGYTILRRLMSIFSDRLLNAYKAHLHLLTSQDVQTAKSYG